MKQIRRVKPNQRRGIGRVEVIVGLCLAVLVLTLIAAAIHSARAAARKLTCMCRLRNVGLSVQNFVSGNGGYLPPLTSEMTVKNDSGEGTLAMTWTMSLLPMLDSSKLLQNIRRNALDQVDQRTGASMTMAEVDKIWLEFFTCPDNPTANEKPGKLSFVINAGFMPRDLYHGDPRGLHRLGILSWNGNETPDELEDVRVGAATGVTWRQNDDFQPSMDHISTGDGTSTTLLLTENLQAGYWYDTDTARIGFGLPIDAKNGQVPFGAGTFFESGNKPLNTEFPGGTLATAKPRDWQINTDRSAAVGTRARPSSNHPGEVTAIMCDGSGRYLSDGIDPHVYVKLLTSNGVKYGEGELKENSW